MTGTKFKAILRQIKEKISTARLRYIVIYNQRCCKGQNRGLQRSDKKNRIEVTEMRLLRWMCGMTRKDKIRNEHIRGTTSDAGFQKHHGEMIEQVWACDEEHILRSVEDRYT